MKKLTLSLTTILAMSTFAVAGGDIAPVEPVVETPMVMEAPAVGGFYLGLGYSFNDVTIENTRTNNNLLNNNFASIMFDAGYKFNKYVAIEGRYWSGISDGTTLDWKNGLPADVTIDAWGLYVKPMYPVTNSFNLYALLGYGSADATYDLPRGGSITSDSTDGFSWGIGADYAITNNWSVFVDYTSVIDGESGNTDKIDTDDSLTTVNVGVNYQF